MINLKNIGVRELKKSKVYFEGKNEEYGSVVDVLFGKENGKVEKIVIETSSLVPILRLVDFDDIVKIGKSKVVIGASSKPYTKNEGCIKSGESPSLTLQNGCVCFLRDMRFDTENGEITDVIVSRHKFGTKRKITINKIFVKDNTVYIE